MSTTRIIYWSQIGPQHAPQSVAASAPGGLLWWLLLLYDDGIGGSDVNIVVGMFAAVNAGDVMSPDISGFMSMSTETGHKTKRIKITYDYHDGWI